MHLGVTYFYGGNLFNAEPIVWQWPNSMHLGVTLPVLNQLFSSGGIVMHLGVTNCLVIVTGVT